MLDWPLGPVSTAQLKEPVIADCTTELWALPARVPLPGLERVGSGSSQIGHCPA